ncbi:MAG: universal stress protein [Gammaproteobacteria bacterium]|nr:universal stress protein [Gammaproteobacteria bacterium]
MADYNNILVAIDFSDTADTIIERAKDIARQNNTDLCVLHVVEYLPPIDVAYEPVLASSWTIDENELLEQAGKSLSKFCDRHNLQSAKQITRVGTPKYEICQYVKDNNCDLIIMGSHGRHGIGRLLGSTANAVLHKMPCDVMAIKIKD